MAHRQLIVGAWHMGIAKIQLPLNEPAVVYSGEVWLKMNHVRLAENGDPTVFQTPSAGSYILEVVWLIMNNLQIRTTGEISMLDQRRPVA